MAYTRSTWFQIPIHEIIQKSYRFELSILTDEQQKRYPYIGGEKSWVTSRADTSEEDGSISEADERVEQGLRE